MTYTNDLDHGLPHPGVGAAASVVDVRKVYGPFVGGVAALDGVTWHFPVASFTAVMGPSGAGKSTLLQVAAGLDEPTAGEVFIDGVSLAGLDEAARAALRRRHVGFVFQQFNLLDALTVAQNVTLPVRLDGRDVDVDRCRVVCAEVGLGDRLGHRPAQLSGGERQRAAIARALFADPTVIFADEPTGALDTASTAGVLALLRDAVRVHGRTVIMVTHDPFAASHAHSVVFLADGKVRGTLVHPTPAAVAERMTHLSDAGTEVTA